VKDPRLWGNPRDGSLARRLALMDAPSPRACSEGGYATPPSTPVSRRLRSVAFAEPAGARRMADFGCCRPRSVCSAMKSLLRPHPPSGAVFSKINLCALLVVWRNRWWVTVDARIARIVLHTHASCYATDAGVSLMRLPVHEALNTRPSLWRPMPIVVQRDELDRGAVRVESFGRRSAYHEHAGRRGLKWD